MWIILFLNPHFVHVINKSTIVQRGTYAACINVRETLSFEHENPKFYSDQRYSVYVYSVYVYTRKTRCIRYICI